jgi:four helix bundle protein
LNHDDEFCFMKTYRNLIVYEKSKEVNLEIFHYFRNSKNLPYYIQNQIGRASLSIMLNIAEGSGRISMADKKHFYVMARASLYETSALIDFLQSANILDKEKAESWETRLTEISKILYALIQKLSNS